MDLEALLSLDRRALGALLAQKLGEPSAHVPSAFLDDTVFRGTTLGNSAFAERLTWKIFRKVVVRQILADGTVTRRGWNVRLEQTGVNGESRSLRTRDGAARCFGPFRVEEGEQGAYLDYGVHENRFSATRFVRDPLVFVGEKLLLGVSNLHLGSLVLGTPTYFALTPERHVEDADVWTP